MSLDWVEFAAAAFETPPPRFQTPGELARYVTPKTVQTPALDLIDKALVEAYETPDARLMVFLGPQEGKALALDTPVPTPCGWSTMGGLRAGDQVFDRHGRPCRVTWVSPVWRDRPRLTVRTGDGETIIADAEHEWFARLDRRQTERVVTTRDLAAPRNKNALITAGASLDLPDADLPLDPYALGAWLGDGHSDGARITIHPDDAAILDRISAAGFPYRRIAGNYAWSLAPEGSSLCSPFRAALKAAGVLGNKHVPAAYMRASEAQRLALLQGLIDTDGHVTAKGQVQFAVTSKALAEGVRELAYSLGAKPTMGEYRARIDGRDCGPKWTVRFYLANAAYLPRKAERCKDSSVADVRYTWAEPAEPGDTVCIEVDSPDHSFLVGRSMLPTHNSTRVAEVFPLWALMRNADARIITASYALSLARRNGRAVRTHIETHGPDLGLRIRGDVAAQSEWQLEGHSGGMYAAGIGGGLTGRPADMLIIDDPHSGIEEAESASFQERAWNWWTGTASARLAPGAPVVLIMTRWHENDLAGQLLAAEDGHLWRVLNIPAQADHSPEKGETDPLGRVPGEYLESTRGRTTAQWEARKRQAGSRAWNALYQGRPAPAEGGLFKRSDWQRYRHPLWVEEDGVRRTTGASDTLILSWDMTFKNTQTSDYVVGQVWLHRGADVYLLDQVRRRMTFTETLAAFKAQVARWPQASAKLVEDKANGTAILDTLRTQIPGLIAVTPKESKEARAAAVSPFVEAHNVHLPDASLAAWSEDLIEEAAAFPNGAHDDQVDALSQALQRLLVKAGQGAAFLAAYRADAEKRGIQVPTATRDNFRAYREKMARQRAAKED